MTNRRRRINGEDVELHYGDEIVPLDERLDRQDEQIIWLKRVMYGLAAILVFHVLLPGQDVLSFLLSLIGL